MSAQLALFASRRERDRILSRMQGSHGDYLAAIRELAREHASRFGSVTIDDVRREIVRHRLPMPKEVGITERVFGVVFRSHEFRALGQVLSSRKERLARSGKGASHITVYALEAPSTTPSFRTGLEKGERHLS